MTIRPPQNPNYEVRDIRYKLDGQIVTVTRVLLIKAHEVIGEWAYVIDNGESTFLDVQGNVFYDRTGIPFQGR